MLATHLGFYNTASSRTHVRFQFSTHAAAGGNVAPNSAFEAADLRIYKATDGAAFSATQRSSANGITMTSPFDSLTGFHDVDIDLTDNTDSGFYAAGSFYSIVLAPDETVDSQTLTGVVLAYFEIGVAAANVTQNAGTAITASGGRQEVNVSHWHGSDLLTGTGPLAGLGVLDRGTAQSDSDTTLQLRAAAAFADDELIGATALIYSATTGAGQRGTISDYVSATDTATLSDTLPTNPTGTVRYEIYGTAAGAAAGGGDATEEKQDTIIALIGTPAADLAADTAAVKSVVDAILVDTGTTLDGRIPAALVNGRMDSTIDGTGMEAGAVTAVQSGLATAAALADVPTNAELATALGTADDAVLAAIAALNNLSAAQVNAEVDTAIQDAFNFSNGNVNANVEEINTVEITGDGQPGTEFGVA